MEQIKRSGAFITKNTARNYGTIVTLVAGKLEITTTLYYSPEKKPSVSWSSSELTTLIDSGIYSLEEVIKDYISFIHKEEEKEEKIRVKNREESYINSPYHHVLKKLEMLDSSVEFKVNITKSDYMAKQFTKLYLLMYYKGYEGQISINSDGSFEWRAMYIEPNGRTVKKLTSVIKGFKEGVESRMTYESQIKAEEVRFNRQALQIGIELGCETVVVDRFKENVRRREIQLVIPIPGGRKVLAISKESDSLYKIQTLGIYSKEDTKFLIKFIQEHTINQ